MKSLRIEALASVSIAVLLLIALIVPGGSAPIGEVPGALRALASDGRQTILPQR